MDEAVALKYNPALPAPFVLAKGRGRIAEKIVEIAEKHGVSLMAMPGLTESLIELDVNEFIPEEYYQLVAELLVFVQRVQEER